MKSQSKQELLYLYLIKQTSSQNQSEDKESHYILIKGINHQEDITRGPAPCYTPTWKAESKRITVQGELR
jgi:hypothetical protein